MTNTTILQLANEALDGALERFDKRDAEEAAKLLSAINVMEEKANELRAIAPSGCDDLDAAHEDAADIYENYADDALDEIQDIIERYSPENIAANRADMQRDMLLTDD